MAKPASGATLNSGHALATNLVLALPFTEGSGSTSADVSTGGRTWTRNAITWTTEGGDVCVTNSDATTNGSLSSALNLPGNQDWTMAWRSRHAAITTNGMLIGEAANTTDFLYARNDAGNRSMRFRDSNNNTGIITGVADFSASLQDYVLVYDNTAQTLTLWRDGVSAGSVAFTAGANIDIDCVIGGNNGTLAHVGTLHYMYVWDNRKLDSTEIGDLHTDPYDFLDPPAPSDSITITNPNMVQRSGTTGTLAVSGTYSATLADHVRARVLLVADDTEVITWATVDASLSGDVWSGSIGSIPEGGPYKCQAHVRDSSNNILASIDDGPEFIVGELFGDFGQSNVTGRGTNLQSYTGSSVAWALQESGSVDKTLSDPISNDAGAAGSWLPLLATLLSAKIGASVPLGFYVYGRGGTALNSSDWLPPSGAEWTAAAARYAAIGLNGVKCNLWLQGEADTALSVSTATYQANEVTLAEAFATLTGGAPLMSILTGHQSAETAADIDDIRKAKINNWAAAETLPGANPIDISLTDDAGDGLHYKTNAELAQLAARIFLALEEQFYGGSNGRGPRLTTSGYEDDTIRLVFDRDLESGDTTYTATAFAATDNASPVTITSVTKVSTRSVDIVCSAPLTGPVTVTYGSGNTAAGATVPRTPDISLPATINSISAVKLPAEPIYAVAVSNGFPVAGGTYQNLLLLGVG